MPRVPRGEGGPSIEEDDRDALHLQKGMSVQTHFSCTCKRSFSFSFLLIAYCWLIKCKRAFRKDMTHYEDSDEYCPHCDNHYVSRSAVSESKHSKLIPFKLATHRSLMPRHRKRCWALKEKTQGSILGQCFLRLAGASTELRPLSTVSRMIKDDRIKVDASRSLYVQQDVSHKLDTRPRAT